MEYKYQIHLYYDGENYVANVPELPSCSGRGCNYVEAVQSAEHAIRVCVNEMEKAGKSPPIPIVVSNGFQSFRKNRGSKSISEGQKHNVKTKLLEKFGSMSNRALALHIGIEGSDAPYALSSALSGSGARYIRCAIAMALDELPSVLWPSRSAMLMEGDDEYYVKLKQKFIQAKSS